MRGIVLSEINDKKLLEKIVKREVYGSNDSKIGSIWKIYIAKKTKQPLKVVIRRVDGELLEVTPDKLRIVGKKIVLVDYVHEGAVATLERLWEIAEELRRLKNDLLVLGERHLVSKEISYEEYMEERKRLERKRLLLKLEAYTLLDTLNYLVQREGVHISRDDEKKLLYVLDVLKSSFPVIPLEKLKYIFNTSV
ncbi:hypothetical protein IG193_04245 [Infirmifilum lucidum]|uniref:PRC-barrel domain-containing protein n=1 Tax=Infirmifilum lucidum TaxID=2776706 RepID=A0A7L9FIS1_9CREN|nr:hypothetical protein [Infirmifilum lucidum]QOJ79670.1 hypothetical protein IG193_04245 [Infirmifilum lucidum]